MAYPPLRIYSWNINGIRAATARGLSEWLRRCKGELVCLQEVRASPEEVPQQIRSLSRWHQHYTRPERRGYSGVGLLARREPDWIQTQLGEERFDREGRLQIARFGRLIVANGYFPNGSGRDRDNSRIPFKLAWYRALFERLQRLRRSGYRVLVVGDFNTAHREIDLARPRQNRKTSGFRPEERAELDRWDSAGWVDSFRAFEAGPGHYSWWSQRYGVREKNIGWRIDYVLASKAAMKFVRGAFIHPDTSGSDHCPIGVDVDPEIFE